MFVHAEAIVFWQGITKESWDETVLGSDTGLHSQNAILTFLFASVLPFVSLIFDICILDLGTSPTSWISAYWVCPAPFYSPIPSSFLFTSDNSSSFFILNASQPEICRVSPALTTDPIGNNGITEMCVCKQPLNFLLYSILRAPVPSLLLSKDWGANYVIFLPTQVLRGGSLCSV